ncbi:DegT/DnrJ/EryC1/StrS family aminotransferase [Ralstonia flaminis]|jgi:perosamine synthetase|uniref:GDP-perosamine synthase n=1 Tax=Ralstonia flaminis TaxID=3058597 RepID=A0ABN9JHG2_9RALS|nr:DegT/DnrJ/EryC1/StrS family aminotransferase [Ralstonia sp. LMG 18101]CAJ0809366.1 GDP-perosamine synthase [Ralstonia sp. LMG 18101]
MTQKILYSKPSITELEVEYATDAARNGWGDQCYAYINRFEKQFAKFVGTQYAIATSSCTGAMHMGLAALGIGAGDEVILADTNWIATASPITYVGATPVFVDILPDTWCVDPAQVEAAITPRTKAIVATHLYGNLCEMDRLLELAERHGIPVIEDAAEAVGSRWGEHAAGARGIFGTFSFHGTKTMTTGEGGMFVTNDRALYDRVMTLNNHGRVPGGKQFWSDFIGFKYRISNVQAAIGCAQLERIDALVARKREIFAAYQQHLGSVAGLALNPEAPNTFNSYWMPTVVFDKALGITRDVLLAAFARRGIDARVFFYPLSQTELFGTLADSARLKAPNSYAIAERAINLPSYHDMSSADINTVSQVVLDLVQEHQEKLTCLAS